MLTGHAYVIAGEPHDIDAVLAWLAQEGIETSSNPDLYVRRYGAFSIDDARELRERVAMRAVASDRRVFVLAALSMNAEAQNALLKTLEEPQGGALIVIVLPSPETLLPTVRSRVEIRALPGKSAAVSPIDVELFIKAAPAQRLDLLKPLLEKGEDDKRDMGDILAFLCALERHFAESSAKAPLHAIYRARRYINDKGALVKPLLEQIALLVC